MKWEYKVATVEVSRKWLGGRRQQKEFEQLNQKLNILGEKGWEMISYESVPLTGKITKNTYDYAYLMFFKRPLE